MSIDVRSETWASCAGVIGFVLCTASCSMPPPSSAELLRTSTAPLPVNVTGPLTVGGQASFGETSAIVESVTTASGNVDLTAKSVGAALALVASSAADVESVGRDVDAASRLAASHARRSFRDGDAHVDGVARERVRHQADAVARGSAKLSSAADVVAKGAALAGFLGAILGGPEEPLLLEIGVDSHGTPYRATCTTKTGESLVQDPRRSLSCVIVRADVVPTSSWRLSIDTVRSGTLGEIVPQSRGWLQREPALPNDVPIWVSRPDTTTPFMRRTESSLSSFMFLKDRVPVAGIQVDCTGTAPRAWLGSAPENDEERQAVEIAMALIALTPWFELTLPDDDSATSYDPRSSAFVAQR